MLLMSVGCRERQMDGEFETCCASQQGKLDDSSESWVILDEMRFKPVSMLRFHISCLTY